MKALRILLIVAVSMMVVGSAFAQEYTFSMGGRADYEAEYSSEEVGDADAVNTLSIGDGGRVQLKGDASKELDNGATASLIGVINIERSEVKVDKPQVKYANGPLTVTMIKADRPGTFKKGIDMYIPGATGDPGRYQNDWVSEQGVCFEYAGDAMKFATTVNVHGENKIGVRPYVEMGTGMATIRVAAEVQSGFPEDMDADGPSEMNYGAGASVVMDMSPIEIGISGTYGMKTGKDDAGEDTADESLMSAYAYAKMSVGPGSIQAAGGYNMESVDEVDDDATGMQFTLSYEQGNIIVPGLKLTVTGGYASATGHDDVDATLVGGKMRLRYEF
jgi:hypothetical protein